jgi:hypothetical protein
MQRAAVMAKHDELYQWRGGQFGRAKLTRRKGQFQHNRQKKNQNNIQVELTKQICRSLILQNHKDLGLRASNFSSDHQSHSSQAMCERLHHLGSWLPRTRFLQPRHIHLLVEFWHAWVFKWPCTSEESAAAWYSPNSRQQIDCSQAKRTHFTWRKLTKHNASNVNSTVLVAKNLNQVGASGSC